MDIIKLQILTDQPELRSDLTAKLKTIDYIMIENPSIFREI